MHGLITQFTAGLDQCGMLVPIPKYNGMAIAAYSASARAKGAPIYLVFGYTSGQQVVATTPVTNTYSIIGFAIEAIGAAQIGLYVISGINVPCLVDDTSALAAGECLEVINGGTYLIDQGGTTVSPITVHAVLEEAMTEAEGGGSAILKNCMVPPSFPYKTIAGS